tara:strand:+ start:1925 stop:2062 length:138 start_codon:yes stop_codon:yes gene_type:complete
MVKKNISVPKPMPKLMENDILEFKKTRKIIKEKIFVGEKVKKKKY